MKIAVFSDIHANLQALQAVIDDSQIRGATEFVSLGDVVGYGPQSEECVGLVRRIGAWSVRGNHDELAVKPVDLQGLDIDPTMLAGLELARKQLGKRSLAWLKSRPLVLQRWGLSITHASFYKPEQWTYLRALSTVGDSFRVLDTPLGLYGHTHQPGFWSEGSDFVECSPLGSLQRVRLSRRTLVNPGSVGNPRTPSGRQDPRAQYMILDLEGPHASFIRVPYDIPGCVRTIAKAGLSDEMASRIELAY